ncbi:MAG: DUF6020 family protein [Clostridia bacterium]
MLTDLQKAQRNFWLNTPWQSRVQRGWFRFCAICLTLYLVYTTYLSQSAIFTGTAETIGACLWSLFYALGLYALLLFGCRRLCKKTLKANKERQKMSGKVFAISVLLSLLVLGCAFMACYPGGVSYDASNQWHQAQTGEFNAWHSLFHTLLIWLITCISNNYSFAIGIQILAFATAMGYLTAVLHKHGIPAWLLLCVQALVLVTPLVQSTLMTLGKDSAMAMGALVLTAHTVHMLYSGGKWLQSPLNAICFGLMLSFTTLMRHNAMLFTVPLLACAWLCYRKYWRGAALSAGVLLLCITLIQGPLFGALDVVYPSNTLEESIGLPMTIMGNTKQKNPEALDDETRSFLSGLATDEAWQNIYQTDQYNAIKFTFDRELIAFTPPEKLLRMTLHTITSDPRTAFEAVNGVTDLVWGVTGKNESDAQVHNSGDIEEARYGSARLNGLGQALSALLNAPMAFAPLRWLCENIGVQMLLLLLVTLWALYQKGVPALCMAIPSLVYNLGTMLLLCGNDARFFQFFMAICLPSVLALLYLPSVNSTHIEK